MKKKEITKEENVVHDEIQDIPFDQLFLSSENARKNSPLALKNWPSILKKKACCKI